MRAYSVIAGKTVSGETSLKPALEDTEAMLEFEFLACFVTVFEKCGARSRGLLLAELGSAYGARMGVAFKGSRLLPKAFAREEAVLEAGSGRGFEVEIGETEVEGRACVFVGEIDAGDSLVVGGKGDRDAGGTVDR